MKIKKVLISFVTILILTFTFGSFSLSANEVQAAPISTCAVIDKAELEYVYVFENGEWWVYVYDGGILIEVYPIDE